MFGGFLAGLGGMFGGGAGAGGRSGHHRSADQAGVAAAVHRGSVRPRGAFGDHPGELF